MKSNFFYSKFEICCLQTNKQIYLRFIARPIGQCVGLNDKKMNFSHSEILENFFNKNHEQSETFYLVIKIFLFKEKILFII